MPQSKLIKLLSLLLLTTLVGPLQANERLDHSNTEKLIELLQDSRSKAEFLKSGKQYLLGRAHRLRGNTSMGLAEGLHAVEEPEHTIPRP